MMILCIEHSQLFSSYSMITTHREQHYENATWNKKLDLFTPSHSLPLHGWDERWMGKKWNPYFFLLCLLLFRRWAEASSRHDFFSASLDEHFHFPSFSFSPIMVHIYRRYQQHGKWTCADFRLYFLMLSLYGSRSSPAASIALVKWARSIFFPPVCMWILIRTSFTHSRLSSGKKTRSTIERM